MADKKISALTSATTPLAGTEVLPIVQSGSTVKVPVSDLTAGRAVSMLSGTITDNIATPVPLNINNGSASTAAGTRVNFQFNGSTVGYVGNQFDGGDFNNLYNASRGHIFTRGATQTMLIDNANNITVSAGNFVVGTAGKGIDFSANTNAPGMTSELLNWYEEGAWTPTIIGSTTAGVGTYSVQVGRYTRIGRMVQVQMFLVWTAHTGTGNMDVAGLPFTSNNTSFNFSGVTIGQFENVTLTALNTPFAYIAANSTVISLKQTPVGGGAAASIPLDTSANIILSATYFV